MKALVFDIIHFTQKEEINLEAELHHVSGQPFHPINLALNIKAPLPSYLGKSALRIREPDSSFYNSLHEFNPAQMNQK